MNVFLGRRFDQEDENGNYVFAMTLEEVLEEPTGDDDITAEVPKEDYPIFFDRTGDAYASVEYIRKNIQYLIWQIKKGMI